VKKLRDSFSYAFCGLVEMCRRERNLRIQLFMLGGAVAAGFILRISTVEWVAIVLAGAGVLATEMLNTALEALADLVSPSYNHKIRFLKDAAAGAVLVMSIAAVAVGLLVFLPKLL
jgi:diacylglycerol kinase (ATP)